ncbi:helix-turn-helix domain-containing protein [Undibacterium sp. Tian12W]|uniref:helix-turn-helix domain-containing protein n=1 Tax=Undibacterium sp. Tian12W TaxID=3413054 RepID=UPI003BF0D4CC
MQETPLGKFLRQHRVKMNYSQRAFASLIGVSESYLSRIENGTSSPSNSALLKKLSEALNLTPNLAASLIFAAQTSQRVLQLPEGLCTAGYSTAHLFVQTILSLQDEDFLQIESICKKYQIKEN